MKQNSLAGNVGYVLGYSVAQALKIAAVAGVSAFCGCAVSASIKLAKTPATTTSKKTV